MTNINECAIELKYKKITFHSQKSNENVIKLSKTGNDFATALGGLYGIYMFFIDNQIKYIGGLVKNRRRLNDRISQHFQTNRKASNLIECIENKVGKILQPQEIYDFYDKMIKKGCIKIFYIDCFDGKNPSNEIVEWFKNLETYFINYYDVECNDRKKKNKFPKEWKNTVIKNNS